MFLFVYFCRDDLNHDLVNFLKLDDLIDFLKSDLLPKLTEIDYRVKKQKVICCEVV